MNIMFVYGDKIVTPALTGSILPGITRSSIIQLAKHLGYSMEEKRLDIEEILEDIRNGTLTEVFGCGTAAVISPVTELIDGDQRIEVNQSRIGPVCMKLKKELIDIQFGRAADPFGWRMLLSSY
jgi:branched-chain amino acid aminotransferase